MKIYIEGTIKLFEPGTFKDKQSGEVVQNNKAYIQGTSGDGVLVLSTKEDFSDYVDQEAVIACELRPSYNEPTKFRVTIIDVKPQK